MKSQFDKNKEEARISEDDIKSYLEGKMDTAAMYNLECKLEDDSFRAAAMEGYEKHPEAINDFDNLKSAFHTKLPDRKNLFWQRYGLYLSAAAVVVFIVSSIALIYFLQPSPTQIGQNIEKTENSEPENHIEKETIKDETGNVDKIETAISEEKQKHNKPIIEKNQQKSNTQTENKTAIKEELTIANKNIEPKPEKQQKEKTSENNIQANNNLTETANLHTQEKGILPKLPKSNQLGGALSVNEANVPAFEGISEDIETRRASQNTKVTYLHNLKVIDYAEVYEQQIERTRMVYNSGVDASYANRNEKNQRAKFSEQVLDSITYIDFLDESLGYYISGSYEKSLDNFAFILKKHPEELNAKFYGALAHFKLGNYSKALSDFNFAIEHPINVFNPESEWYKAQCQVRLGKLKKAEIQLKLIILEKGFYSPKASLLLQEIQNQ